MLNDSPRLIKPLWAELVRTACYIKNRMLTSSIDKFLSSYEKLLHRSPPIEHLKMIGSTCYCYNTGRISGKLDERSTECHLVRYESENLFQLFDPATRKVFRARDVVIKELIDNVTQDKELSTNMDQISNIQQNVILENLTTSRHVKPSQSNYKSAGPVEESVQSPSVNQYHTAIPYPEPASKSYPASESDISQ